MKQFLLGKSSVTSIVGYLLAGLMVVDDMTKAGETNWVKIGIAVLIAILGRVSADAGKTKKDDLVGPRPGDR